MTPDARTNSLLPQGYIVNYKNKIRRAAWVAQWFSTAFRPGPDPGDLGSSSHAPASPSACVSAYLSLSLEQINKIFKK